MAGTQSQAMVPPINCVFDFFQRQVPVSIWLFEQVSIRIRGTICGFDEFMNVVLEGALEVPVDSYGKEDLENSQELGRILLKGDNITLITPLEDN